MNLNDALLNNPAAQAMATDEALEQYAARNAAADSIAGMTPEQQQELLSAGLTKIRYANPRARLPVPEPMPKLEIYSAADLYGKHLVATPMVVRDMIPVGLTVIAGQPKRGKSWLALALSLAVTQGRQFLGRETLQGAVLYLDIESRDYRVQQRLTKLQPEEWPKNLYISHDCPPIGPMFYKSLEEQIKELKLKLIIIDTLARVKVGAKKADKNANAYEGDTGLYGELQKWAQKNSVAVLAIHHMRKSAGRGGDDEDWYERINGSNGLSGVADAVIGLGGKRGEQVSTLNVSGRDIEGDYKLAIRFAGGQWTLEGSGDPEEYAAERAYNESEVVRGVIALMRVQNEWRGSSAELMDKIVEVTRKPLTATQKVLEGQLEFHKARLYERTGITVGRAKPSGRKRVIVIINTRSETGQIRMEGTEDEQERQGVAE